MRTPSTNSPSDTIRLSVRHFFARRLSFRYPRKEKNVKNGKRTNQAVEKKELASRNEPRTNQERTGFEPRTNQERTKFEPNSNADRSLCGFDVTHRLAGSVIYSIPGFRYYPGSLRRSAPKSALSTLTPVNRHNSFDCALFLRNPTGRDQWLRRNGGNWVSL
jgi:hypothetical protein